MSLLTRLIDPLDGEEKIPVHQFTAGLAEVFRGQITRSQFIAGFGIKPDEEAQLDSFISHLAGSTLTREEVHDVLLLAENGFRTPSQVLTRLGF